MFAISLALAPRRRPRTGAAAQGFAIDFRAGTATGVAFSSIQCSRASAGTALDLAGNLATFGPNAPRRTDRGLLVEGAATNIARDANDFASAAWVKGAGLTLSTVADGPLGTATRLATTAGTQAKWLYNATAFSGSGGATRSLYAKAGSLGWISIASGAPASDGVSFNLVTGTVGTANGTLTGRVAPTGMPGWWRIEVTSTGFPGFLTITPQSADNQTQGWNAAAGQDLFIAGAQCEAGAVATSWIPTTGVAATRAVDAVWLAFPGTWGNASEGVFVVTMAAANTGALGQFANNDAMSLSANGTLSPNGAWLVGRNGGGTGTALTYDAGASAQASGLPAAARRRLAIGYRVSDARFAISIDGANHVTGTGAAYTGTGTNRLGIGGPFAIANAFIETIRFIDTPGLLADAAAMNALTVSP